MRYEGPRQFAVADPQALQRDLQAMASQIDRIFQARESGGPWRLLFADPTNVSGALSLGMVTPVASGVATAPPPIELTLPVWRASIVGLLTGVERRQASGLVTVRPCGGDTLNDAPVAITLPNALRVYLFVATPIGWKGADNA